MPVSRILAPPLASNRTPRRPFKLSNDPLLVEMGYDSERPVDELDLNPPERASGASCRPKSRNISNRVLEGGVTSGGKVTRSAMQRVQGQPSRNRRTHDYRRHPAPRF